MHPALEQVDWEREGGAVVELLAALLRFDTTNPPGNEAEAVEFLADTLRAAGVEPEVLSPAPGRANLVARLAGGDGAEAPLLLNGHVDVVAAEAGRWRHPPFAGEVHDGVLWGRGAVDMKQMVAMSVATVGLLARLGVPLRRELKLAVVADEEAGCAAGSAWLVDHHPDKVRAGHALGEVGGATFYLGGRPFYPVQVAEKGIAWLRAVATGATGHGSIPRDDNAVVRLSEFLARVGRRRLPLHASPEARRFLEALTAAPGPGRPGRPAAAAAPPLVQPGPGPGCPRPGRGPPAQRGAAQHGQPDRGPRRQQGQRHPRAGRGRAGRPHRRRLQRGRAPGRAAVPGRPRHRARAPRPQPPPDRDPARRPRCSTSWPPWSPTTTRARWPSPPSPPASPTPSSGRELGTACYGFAPLRLEPSDPDFAAMFHGDDERVPVAGLQAGLRMLADTVARWCCQ